jgi:hypothetical protein
MARLACRWMDAWLTTAVAHISALGIARESTVAVQRGTGCQRLTTRRVMMWMSVSKTAVSVLMNVSILRVATTAHVRKVTVSKQMIRNLVRILMSVQYIMEGVHTYVLTRKDQCTVPVGQAFKRSVVTQPSVKM